MKKPTIVCSAPLVVPQGTTEKYIMSMYGVSLLEFARKMERTITHTQQEANVKSKKPKGR